MDNTLTNLVTASGTYNLISTVLTSDAVVTQLVSGLTIVKVADKGVWTDGYLTYTITLTNNAQYDFETPTLNDILDPTFVTLVEDSVMVDDAVTAYTYDEITGALAVTLPTIEVDGSTVVTFQVAKK